MNDGDFLRSADPTAAFGAVAQNAPLPPMVDFHGHNGRSLAVPYRRLVSLSLVDESHIELELAHRRILLYGRNLAPLYSLLVQNRVTFVREGDLDLLSEAETFVHRIVITPTEDMMPGL